MVLTPTFFWSRRDATRWGTLALVTLAGLGFFVWLGNRRDAEITIFPKTRSEVTTFPIVVSLESRETASIVGREVVVETRAFQIMKLTPFLSAEERSDEELLRKVRLTEALKTQALRLAAREVSPDRELLPETLHVTKDFGIVERESLFRYLVQRAEYAVLTIPRGSLDSVAQERIESSSTIGRGLWKALSNRTKVAVTNFAIDPESYGYYLTLEVKLALFKPFEMSELAELTAGEAVSDARALLKARDNIEDVAIRLLPFWRRHLPSSSKEISIRVE
ncbi:MAG: hypothetical protein HY459_01915 [Parcubacteria group bacterium]|nr:hypothetical protein [Parcubacteria group bacterium]